MNYFDLAVRLARAEAMLTLAQKRRPADPKYLEQDEPTQEAYERHENFLFDREEAKSINGGF